MDASFDCAKRSLTELLFDLVVCREAVRLFEFHLLLERQEVFLDLLLLLPRRSAVLNHHARHLTIGIKDGINRIRHCRRALHSLGSCVH